MNDKEKFIVRIGIAALAVMVSAYLLYSGFLGRNRGEDLEPSVTKEATDSMPNNFPADLELNAKVGKNSAYSITYPDSIVKQGTVTFDSAASAVENFEYYEKWAQENGWEIINGDKTPPVLSLYLRKSSEDINITMNGHKVTISHAQK